MANSEDSSDSYQGMLLLIELYQHSRNTKKYWSARSECKQYEWNKTEMHYTYSIYHRYCNNIAF
jgi:hypothetical protein